MMRLLSDAAVMTGRNVHRTMRQPDWVMFVTIQPVMFVVLFRYVFGGAINTGSESYVNFLMAGIFVQTVTFGSMATGFGLCDDIQRGVMDRFRSLPMHHSMVVFGRILHDMVINSLSIVIMVAVGVLVGFRPIGSAPELVLGFALLLLISFTFSWIGAIIGLTMRTVEAVNSFGFIWLFPLTFVSSAFVPPDTMPSWLRGFAEHQPLTRMVNAVRALSLNTPYRSDLLASLGWCALILIVFVPLATRRFSRAALRS